MPRNPRNYIETNYFHIIAQGINKSYIFKYDEDIKFYISNMYKLKEECKINIIAYCVMNNHVHILIETSQLQNLTKFMQRLNTIYGIYYNKKYNRVGYVFRNRYLSEGIYNEVYLSNCINYIHNNPVKANICKSPDEYPYSSYKNIKKVERKSAGNYVFMDIDEDKNRICKNNILEFLENNKMSLDKLKQNEKMLKELIIILKEEQKISLRRIAENLEMNREYIRKLYNSD